MNRTQIISEIVSLVGHGRWDALDAADLAQALDNAKQYVRNRRDGIADEVVSGYARMDATDQPRDERGRFSGGGGSSDPAKAPNMPHPSGLHVMHDPSGDATHRATNAEVAEYLGHGTINGSRDHSLAKFGTDKNGNEVAESLTPDEAREHIAARERGDADYDLLGNITPAARRRRDAALLAQPGANGRVVERAAPRTDNRDYGTDERAAAEALRRRSADAWKGK